MGETTEISWTDHTFQPWMGCTKVVGSPACDHCYAETLGKRTGKVEWGDDAVRVTMSEGYWRNPEKWERKAAAAGVRHRVFCASLADVFEDRPELDEHRARLFALIDRTPHLDWQLLTKRPENITRMVPSHWLYRYGPRNVWYGTTVEDQEHADERIPQLLAVPARVRFLSCEPLLGEVDLRLWDTRVDWVIVGGESGPGHRQLVVDHARSIRNQCQAVDIPFFFKQQGGRTAKAGGHLLDGEEWHEFPVVSWPT